MDPNSQDWVGYLVRAIQYAIHVEKVWNSQGFQGERKKKRQTGALNDGTYFLLIFTLHLQLYNVSHCNNFWVLSTPNP
jgi:hypothetical protein